MDEGEAATDEDDGGGGGGGGGDGLVWRYHPSPSTAAGPFELRGLLEDWGEAGVDGADESYFAISATA